MKQLRILTGIHAGATAPLGPGLHRIDADDDADIRITDWTGPSAIVEVRDHDIVTVRRLASPADIGPGGEASQDAHAPQASPSNETGATDAQAVPDERVEDTAPVYMLNFLPMQFDQSVICVGPEDVKWPSDLALLSTLLKPAEPGDSERATARSRRRTSIALSASCVALAVIASVSVLSMTTRAKASLLPNDVAAMENVNREFAAAHLNELHASLDGHGGVLVRGLVADDAENLAAHRLLASITSPRVRAQYGIAEVIRRSIGESLPISGISVRYDGRGVFSIAGKNIDIDALQTGVKRIRPDLPAEVKDIRIDATGAEGANAPVGASYTAIVSSDAVRYAQTPDGVKHIFILDNEASASDIGAANAASGTDSLADAATPESSGRASLAMQLVGPAGSQRTPDQPQACDTQTNATLRR